MLQEADYEAEEFQEKDDEDDSSVIIIIIIIITKFYKIICIEVVLMDSVF
jgi:hypothetical protein